MRVLAVDFGTSNTVAAVRIDEDPARLLSFGASLMVPSGVFSSGHGLVVGAEAIRLARSDPARYEPNPKRRVDDSEVLLGSTVHPVVDLVAAVLRAVATESLRQLGRDPDQVRLTHPAHWGSLRRGLLITAARRAGLGDAVLVPEPVAAAARYAGLPGSALSDGGTLAVYDLGGGTFDVALVRRDGDALVVVAEGGRGDIGGLDLDHAVLDHLTETVGRADPAAWERLVRPVDAAGRRAARALREDVQHAKESLSDYPQTEIALPAPFPDVLLTRTEFEALIRSRIADTIGVLDQTVRNAGLRPADLAGIFLVGGASRVPMVAREITERLGVVAVAQDQPETAVVLGALEASAGARGSVDPVAGVPTPATTLALSSRTPAGAPGVPDLDGDATAVIPDPDRTAVVADPDRTAVVADPDRTTVLGDPDRTMVVPGRRTTATSQPAPSTSSKQSGPAAPYGPRGRMRPSDRRRRPAVLAGLAATVTVVLIAGLVIWQPWGGKEVAGTSATVVSGSPLPPVPPTAPSTAPSIAPSTAPSKSAPPSTPRSTPPSLLPSRVTTKTTPSRTTGRSSVPPATTLLGAVRNRTVVIGIQQFDTPGLSTGGAGGDVSGVMVELAREAIKRVGGSGLTLRYVGVAGPEEEKRALASGEISMMANTYDLSGDEIGRAGPVVDDTIGMLVAADSEFTDLSSLGGARLCEVYPSVTPLANAQVGGGLKVVKSDSLADCVDKVRAGTVDLALLSPFWIGALIEQEPGRFRAIASTVPGIGLALGVGRSDVEGKAALDEALQSMIDDGTWTSTIRRGLASTGLPTPPPPKIGEFG